MLLSRQQKKRCFQILKGGLLLGVLLVVVLHGIMIYNLLGGIRLDLQKSMDLQVSNPSPERYEITLGTPLQNDGVLFPLSFSLEMCLTNDTHPLFSKETQKVLHPGDALDNITFILLESDFYNLYWNENHTVFLSSIVTLQYFLYQITFRVHGISFILSDLLT